ncbi:Protein trichome birefringence-like 18 [Hibiscus syriacus]|uniref:Protein trichome birefringence-like 18 n=1 Tax=Hibiscus syriacus TaxID=106335 RepID=A0A6A3DB30_HIBSY|nr:Protein trichome birefringence-like 18 [Hibiscus syriacus]
MTLASPRGSAKMAAVPRGLASVATSILTLAMLLIFAYWLLVPYPVGSTVRGYNNSSSGSNLELPGMSSNHSSVVDSDENALASLRSSVDKDSLPSDTIVEPSSSGEDWSDSKHNEMLEKPVELPKLSSRATEKVVDTSSFASSNTSESNSVGSACCYRVYLSRRVPNLFKPHVLHCFSPPYYSISFFKHKEILIFILIGYSVGCDLYNGKWFYDPQGASYTNNSCPVITQMQNCQGNGRPDKEYENWRWKPSKCDLPRVDAKKFLELMRGKTLAFIGDSVARNQMESMLCLLWKASIYILKSLQFVALVILNIITISKYFSNCTRYLKVCETRLKFRKTEETEGCNDGISEGVTKLHLDAPDNKFMEFIPNIDVIVISSGHWFSKQSVYVLNNEIVGGQLWWPDQSRPMKVNNVEAFGISVETILSAILTQPNYTGLTIMRTFCPDHYEGGAWNSGGSCTGKENPLAPGEMVENGFTNIMHEKQVSGFKHAVKKATNKSKLRFMDITQIFGYRHNGHPGPYRSPDPNKMTKRGPDGRPPPQDCLHWCMPGPVDTWNDSCSKL